MVADSAVSDSGPLIHLFEIGRLEALLIVGTLLIPPEVSKEIGRGSSPVRVGDMKRAEVRSLGPEGKDRAAALCGRFGLDLGEAEAIALCLENSIKLVFTDDLDARYVASKMKLDPHGSVGILLRAYSQGTLSQEEVLQSLDDLSTMSSLYVTSELVKQAKKAVNEYRKPI